MDSTVSTNKSHPDQSMYIAELEERVIQLTEQLGATTYAPLSLGLSRSEATIVNMLRARELLTRDAAYTVLYGVRGDGGPEPKIFDVFMVKIRRKLRLHDVVVETVWGRGWYIDADSRAKLQAIYGEPAPWASKQ